MAREVWKEYEDNLLTHSAAHYLMTIHELLQEPGYARVTDVAKRMNITRGSCSVSLKSLKKRGFVVEDENKFLQLSDEGLRLAELVEHNDQLLETFFRDVLGVDHDQAEIDACKIEHLLSIETSIALHRFLELFTDGHPAAENLLKEQRRLMKKSCDHDAENCGFCNSMCFLEEAGEILKKRS